jgi:sugar phosphate permease
LQRHASAAVLASIAAAAAFVQRERPSDRGLPGARLRRALERGVSAHGRILGARRGDRRGSARAGAADAARRAAPAGAGLLALAAGTRPVMSSAPLGLAALAMTALMLIGPYSLLAGAMALEIGGKQGAATTAGLIDTAGYLGALMSGIAIGAAAEMFGWSASWRLLGIVTVVGAAIAALLAWLEGREARGARAAVRAAA